MSIPSPPPSEPREVSYEQLKQRVETLKSKIGNPKIDIRTTQVAFMALNEEFRTYTHASHTELNAKEKLELRRVFIDLTDTISEKVVEQMRSKPAAEPAVSKSSTAPAKESEAEGVALPLEESPLVVESEKSTTTESGIAEPKAQGTSGMFGYMWSMASNVIGTATVVGKTLVQTAIVVAKTATNALGVTTPAKTEAQELEGMLMGLMGIQAALYDKTHPMSVEHAKDLINQTLKNVKESDVETIAELGKFLQSEAVKEQEHQDRAKKIKEGLDEIRNEEAAGAGAGLIANITEQTASFVKMVSDAAVDYLKGKKKEAVESYVKQFTPQELFGNQSFKVVITDLIEDLLKQGGYKETSIIKKMAMIEVNDREKFLSENLAIIAEERNLACLGVNMAEELRHVASKLRELGDDATPEKMIAALGYLNGKGEVMSLEAFQEKMDVDITTSFARLISKDAVISQEQEQAKSQDIAKGLWGIIRGKFRKAISKLKKAIISKLKNKMVSKVQTKIAESVLKKVSPPSWIVSAFFPKAEALKSKAGTETVYQKGYAKQVEGLKSQVHALGFEKGFAQLEKCYDVLMLHLFCRLTQGMSEIASQSKTNVTHVATGYEDSAKANANLRAGIRDLSSELSKFKPEKQGLVEYGLDQLSGFFGKLVTEQGTGSLLDVTTDAVAILQPAWKEWLSGQGPSGEAPKPDIPAKT